MTLREELALAREKDETVELRVEQGRLVISTKKDRLEVLRRAWSQARARVQELEEQIQAMA